jgi:hypothetical protein
MTGDKLPERYEATMPRLEQITRAGYQDEIQWECEYDTTILTRNPELRTHPMIEHGPLVTRDALYGRRTEAVSFHYKIGERKAIQYVDVMSLYPHICKYYKFRNGHPFTNVGDACQDIKAMLRKKGLVKFLILPSRHLYHPVLPFRCNNQLLFCHCKTCAWN